MCVITELQDQLFVLFFVNKKYFSLLFVRLVAYVQGSGHSFKHISIDASHTHTHKHTNTHEHAHTHTQTHKRKQTHAHALAHTRVHPHTNCTYTENMHLEVV